MEKIKDNIVTQIENNDYTANDKTFFDIVNDIYNTYLNTLNNETLQYLNIEDERIGSNNKYIRTDELGLNIDDNPLLRIGGCERYLYFRISDKENIRNIKIERTFDEIETHEKIELIKEQWLRKFKLSKVLIDLEQCDTKDIGGLKIRTSSNICIYDSDRDNSSVVLIKPVNDSAKSIRNIIFPDFKNKKSNPMNIHLAEALALIIFYRKPVKLLYVGKNDSKLFKYFDIALKDKCITIDGKIIEGINVSGISTSLGILKKSLNEDIVPPRGFVKPRLLSKEEVSILKSKQMINVFEEEELLKGDLYESFRCKTCPYRSLCNSLPEGFVENK